MSRFVLLDLMILGGCVSAVVGGYRIGFVARALSWVGLTAGLVVAVATLPRLVRSLDTLTAAGRLSIVVLVILGGALVGQTIGLATGSRLASAVPSGKARIGDKILGAVAGAGGLLVALWLMLPTAANVPGWPSQQVRSSMIAQAIYREAPKPPDAIDTLRRLVGADTFPNVFEGIGPSVDLGPPPESTGISPDVLQRVRASTVKVEGSACRRRQDGSGFAVGPGLIATNAHVVAGEQSTKVLMPNGQSLAATVVLFDANRDLALLSVPRYNQAPLPVADPDIGETGAIFGHPDGQDPLRIQPASVRRRIVALGRDLYGRNLTRRDVLILASKLRPGDSGGALVDADGKVIGVAFAIAPDQSDTAYALHTAELKAVLGQPHDRPANTGPCIND